MPQLALHPSRPVVVPDAPSIPENRWQRFSHHPSVFLFVVLTAQLMVVLDGTIVNVALPHIERGLGFTATSLSWVLNAYILTFGGLLLLGARAGDLLGRRRTFLFGIGLFSVSSLVGGFSQAAWMLLAARSFQGIGAALAAPSSLALLTATFREGAQRTRAIGLFTAVSSAGAAVGLVAGGLLTDLLSWRWVMFVNVPIGLTVLVVGHLVLNETPPRTGKFDLTGAATSTIGLTGIVLGLVEAGSTSWSNPLTFVPLVVGATLLGAFIHNEAHAEEPILPLRLLTHATRSAANVARGLLYAGIYAMFFFMSQLLQDIDGYSSLRAGMAFLPLPIALFASSQVASRVLTTKMQAKTLILSGIGFSVASLLVATRINAGSSYGLILIDLVLQGVGAGTSFVALTSASLVDVDPKDAGAASGLINVIQQIGAAFGLAVLVTVFGTATHHVPATNYLISAETRAMVMHGFAVAFKIAILFPLAALALVAIVIPRPARNMEVAEIEELLEDDTPLAS